MFFIILFRIHVCRLCLRCGQTIEGDQDVHRKCESVKQLCTFDDRSQQTVFRKDDGTLQCPRCGESFYNASKLQVVFFHMGGNILLMLALGAL
jgi:protein-arginine kinase activator protein McsA